MHLLYLNGENLHDCAEMEDTNINFTDLIKVKGFSQSFFQLFLSRLIRIIKLVKYENEVILRTVLKPIVRL